MKANLYKSVNIARLGVTKLSLLVQVRITYRTFSPLQLGVARSNKPIEYEGMRTLLERVNQWLQITSEYRWLALCSTCEQHKFALDLPDILLL